MSERAVTPEANGTEYDTVQLEAPEESREDSQWTHYPLRDNEPSIPTSPVVSEITPEVDEDKPEFLSSSHGIQISVSNPKKAEEISKLGIRTSFTSYFVQTETHLPEYPFTKRAVWRRFKDFDTLHRLLRENHRGFIIPSLPSKNYFESKRGKDSFIRERQLELNKFLNQVTMHGHLYNTEEMKIFLGYTGELSASHEWYQLMENAKQLLETPIQSGQADLEKPVENMKRDVTAVLKKMSNSFKRDMTHRSYAASDTERRLQEMVPQLKQFELQLTTTAERSRMMLTEFECLGNELGLLGRIWLTISRFEEGFTETFGQYSEMGRALVDLIAALHKSGYAAVRIQQICNKSGNLLKAKLAVMTDHVTIFPAIMMSLHDRTLVLRQLYDSQSKLESSRRTLDHLTRESTKKLGGTAGFANKSAAITSDIQSHITDVSKHAELYDVVTKRNLSELETQNINRRADFLDMVLSLAKMQQEYYETIALVWVNLAEEISRMEQEAQLKT